ncbi:MAG: MDR family MFS transporter [Propionibacteriaceae bacterium]|nr:MDR family MFS transporter [Propionibacteriaceae bacterium]
MTDVREEFEFSKIRWIYFGLLIGMFTSSISQTIVSPAIPRIIADLGGVEYYSWLSTIVMLVMTIVTPISGKLSDMFGRKRFYALGLIIFMLGNVLSGVAQSFAWLVAARAIQGMGMGILMPLSQTILGDIIPPRQRGKYAGYMGALMGASQVAGPLIGGFITDVSTWRWLFYVNLPVGFLALFLVVKFMNIPELDIPRRIDHAGIATMTIGVSAGLLGISFGGTRGWLDPLVLVLLGLGLVFLVAFVFVERRAAEPIVPLSLFRNSIFTWSVLAGSLMNMVLMMLIIYTPVYAQGVLGVSATASGAILIPMNVGLFAMGIVIGNLTTRTGRYKSFAVAGVVLMAGASILLLRLGARSTPLELTLYTSLMGLGVGMSFQIYTLTVQNAVQRRDLGPATSALQFFRSIANTMGTAIAGTLMTSQLVTSMRWRMTPEAIRDSPPGGLDPNAVLNPSAMQDLPESVALVLRLSLADAMQAIYAVLPWLSLAVLATTLAIRAIPLRDSFTPDEPGQSAALSVADPQALNLSPEEHHTRNKERMYAAHLILLAEQVQRSENEILRAAVAEFGGGDLDRGRQLLRSTSTMLLAEDPALIDEHESFAVELAKRGQPQKMLSDSLTERLNEVARRVAAQSEQIPSETPTKPRLGSVDGLDAQALQRALWMLDSALVADFASRRFAGEVAPEASGPESSRPEPSPEASESEPEPGAAD